MYKNRGGKYNNIKIWLNVDYDTMRVHDAFVTDYNGSTETEAIIGLKKKHIDISTPDKTLVEESKSEYKIDFSELRSKLNRIPWTKSNSEYKNSTLAEEDGNERQLNKEEKEEEIY